MTFEWVPQREGFFRRYKLLCEGRLVLCFNDAPEEPAFWLRQRRPSLHPLCTPLGVPVTEQGGHTMPHHKGCWIAHGNVGGVGFYTDEGETGLIRTRSVAFRATAYVASFDAEIEWVAPGGRTILTERRRHRVRAGAQATRVDVTTELNTPLESVDLAREKHGFFHLRPLDVLSEDQGGIVTASNGRTGCDRVYGEPAHWVDLRGRVGPNPVGVILMCAGDPQPVFARSYGTIALNPFLHEGRVLARGAPVSWTYSITAYDDPDRFDRALAYEAFRKTASEAP